MESFVLTLDSYDGKGRGRLIDVFRFDNALKLGPAVVYRRLLPRLAGYLDEAAHFDGNLVAGAGVDQVVDARFASPMREADFWLLIEESGSTDSDGYGNQISERLSRLGISGILGFYQRMAQLLNELDDPLNSPFEHAEDERGLMLRCWTILQGPRVFRSLLEHPGSLTWRDEMDRGELLLHLAGVAYALLLDTAEPMIVSDIQFATGSNESKWQQKPLDLGLRASVEHSDQERIADWYESWPAELRRDMWGPEDSVWDEAAALATRWFTVRAIRQKSGELYELLVWIGSRGDPNSTGAIEVVRRHLTEAGYEELPQDLIEIYDTEWLRPHDSIEIFRIERKSRLSADEYLARYVYVGAGP